MRDDDAAGVNWHLGIGIFIYRLFAYDIRRADAIDPSTDNYSKKENRFVSKSVYIAN